MSLPRLPRLLLLLSLLAACASFSSASSSKLNVPRVLLPHSDEGTDFTLEASEKKHCYKWKSSRTELVSVSPITDSNGCSHSAVVRSESKSWSKVQAIITAEDTQSPGHLLRCDVIVDTIHKLHIVTKTHELFLEEPPEEFWVRAYDDQGNEFSTLKNIVFKWTIDNLVKKSASKSSHGDNIKFILFRDSTYDLEKSIMAIEGAGKQGSKVLLEGIKTGSSKVSVKLVSSSYVGKVQPADVNVMVVANLYLVPDMAYIMVGAHVTYNAEQIKSNKIHQISLPSPQYYLSLSDTTLAKLASASSARVTGLALGSSEVRLRDHNVADEDAVKPPTAELHVVEPARVSLRICRSNWNVLVGEMYTITVEVYDAQDHRMFASDNLVIEFELAKEYFRVAESTANGTYHFGSPLKAGITEVRAKLIGVKDDAGKTIALKTPLATSELMEIFDPIVLDPALAVFPFDPVSSHSYSLTYNVAGGSEPFFWSSSETSVATLAQSGIVRTTTAPNAKLGVTDVAAAMKKAMHNVGRARVALLPASALALLPDRLEVELGQSLPLPVAIYANHKSSELKLTNQKLLPFSQCQHVPLATGLVDGRVFEAPGSHANNVPTSDSEACTYLDMKAKAPGFTSVKVTYTFPASAGQAPLKLNAETKLAAYRPLTPVQPSATDKNPTAALLLAVESSAHVVWSGGPAPWVDKPEGFFSTLSISDDSVVSAGARLVSRSPSGLYVFPVKCLTLGETELILSVGNKASDTLKNPVVATSSVKVTCGQPDALELSAEVTGPAPGTTGQPCPLTARAGRIAALAYENLNIRVTVLDANGRKFDNVTSLGLEWGITDANLGVTKTETGVMSLSAEEDSAKNLGYKPLDDAYQVLLTKSKTGNIDVTATLKKSSGYMGFNAMKASVQLNLVNDATVEPASVSIFNHPDNREFLQVHQGSGYFEVANGNGVVAETRYLSTNQTVRITPLSDGDAVLTIRDLCLKAKKSPQARAHVTGVHKVDLLVTERVQRLRTVNAQVRLLDRHGKELQPSAHRFMTISVTSASNIVKIYKDQDSPLSYTIKGLELGETTLTANVRFGSQHGSSSPQPLQVFPPLKIEPRNVTLIIGARFQVRTVGGPQPDSTVEYALGSKTIAKVNQVGLIDASTLGSTTLSAKAVGTDKITGKPIVYSEDTIDVHVVKLTAVRVSTPITRIVVGAEMPVTAVGTDEHQNAYAHGSALPYLDLAWSLESNPDAADLVSPFDGSGVGHVGGRNQGTLRLRALRPGRTVIKLRARVSQPLQAGLGQFQLDKDQVFTDTLEIVVFENMHLTKPNLPSNHVLMTPGSNFQLRTNREGSASEIRYSVLASEGNHLLSVSRGGLLTSEGSQSQQGSCVVLVESVEEFGVVQRTSIVVHVRPASYMMINAKKAFSTQTGSKPMTTLPKGFVIDTEVSYHDNVGNRFDAVSHVTDFRPSRFDTLSTRDHGNGSLSAELLREEYTVLRAFTVGSEEREQLQDFLIFHTGGKAIVPDIRRKSLLVGDVIDLDSVIEAVRDDDGASSEEGVWMAQPDGMLHIDPKTGVVMALRSGHSKVSYFVAEGGQRTTVDMEVKAAKEIRINTLEPLTRSKTAQFITFVVQSGNGNETSNFHGNRKQSNEEEGKVYESPLFACRARFTDATVPLSDYFSVSTVFSSFSHACRFTPKEALFNQRTALIDSDIAIDVVSTGSSMEALSASERLPFVPGFHVVQDSLEVSNTEARDELLIQGLPSVLNSLNIEVSNDQLLAVGSDFTAENSRTVPIRLLSTYWSESRSHTSERLFVTLTSTMTTQRVTIPIRVILSGQGCPQSGELSWLSFLSWAFAHYQYILFLALSMCVAYVFAIRMKAAAGSASGQKKLGGPPPGAAGSPRLQSTLLSPSTSHWVSSPQTPQQQQPLQNSERAPYLFTADNSPIYGGPGGVGARQRSPRPLAQYSYTDQ